MKEIKVGKVNDRHLFAIETTEIYDGQEITRYYPMRQMDFLHQPADAKIYYDSGLYPDITLDELPQYICNKASSI